MTQRSNLSLFSSWWIWIYLRNSRFGGGGVPQGTTKPVFNVIIPPNGGHGYDIYRELGIVYLHMHVLKMTLKTLTLSLVTSFARVGLVENPQI